MNSDNSVGRARGREGGVGVEVGKGGKEVKDICNSTNNKNVKINYFFKKQALER